MMSCLKVSTKIKESSEVAYFGANFTLMQVRNQKSEVWIRCINVFEIIKWFDNWIIKWPKNKSPLVQKSKKFLFCPNSITHSLELMMLTFTIFKSGKYSHAEYLPLAWSVYDLPVNRSMASKLFSSASQASLTSFPKSMNLFHKSLSVTDESQSREALSLSSYKQNWNEWLAFQRSGRRSTAGNDVVATIFISLFFFSCFFAPLRRDLFS